MFATDGEIVDKINPDSDQNLQYTFYWLPQVFISSFVVNQYAKEREMLQCKVYQIQMAQ